MQATLSREFNESNMYFSRIRFSDGRDRPPSVRLAAWQAGSRAGSRAHCLRVLLPPRTPTQDIRNLGREVRHHPTRRNARSRADVRTRNRNLSSTKPTARTTVGRSSVSKGLVWVGSLRSNYDDRNPIFRSGILRSLSISTGYKNGRPILEDLTITSPSFESKQGPRD